VHQNALLRIKYIKNFLVRGLSPLPRPHPHWGGGNPLPRPHHPRRLASSSPHWFFLNSTTGHEIGLNVAAVTSDMGSPNRAMWKKLGIVIGRGIAAKNSFPHPCNSENNVCILADVPHLIKNVRNHIVSGQDIVLPQHIVQRFQLPSATVSVAPLNRLVKFQEHPDLKPAPRLTSKHLDISHFDKMKVSQALHVFSHSVSSALRLMVATENWEENVLTTAWFLKIMNKWFELMTSRHLVWLLANSTRTNMIQQFRVYVL